MGQAVKTTHAGSLPRPADLTLLMFDHQEGKGDDAEIEKRLGSAVDEVVAKQLAIGLDIISDGEFGKPGHLNYVRDRLTGFSGVADGWLPADLELTPALVESQYGSEGGAHILPPLCEGEVTYRGHAELQRDLENFAAAREKHGVQQAFMPAASPGVIAGILPNRYYKTYDEYLSACAMALREEYVAIIEAGLELQLDAPDVAMVSFTPFWAQPIMQEMGLERWLDLHVDAMNQALSGLPAERIRLHICYGNYEGPHHLDQPLERILQPLLKANVGQYSFEASNPRHSHEWRIFEDLDIGDETVIIPGVIDTVTNFVEHPQVVADRIDRFVGKVGRERVIAGTDCGFGTFVGFGNVDDTVTFMKLESLVRGAELASA
jgi:5-methyltetrahydropteroyltriglutamate--homocysteine methyltransferase